MKNSILFYLILLGAVFGGIKWTAHSLLEKKKANLGKTNFQEAIIANLHATNDTLAGEMSGKAILIYYWSLGCEDCFGEISKLNTLAAKYPQVHFISAVNAPEDNAAATFRKKKLEMVIHQIYEPAWLQTLMLPIAQVYAKTTDPEKPHERVPEVLLVDSQGKVAWYSVGKQKDLLADIEKVIE